MVTKTRFGIGEFLGRNSISLTPPGRAALREEKQQDLAICPARQSCLAFDPRGVPKGGAKCTKPGGICSVRKYRAEFVSRSNDSLIPETIETIGSLATICPHRFLERGEVYSWIGRELLGTPRPQIVRELRFLENAAPPQPGEPDDEEAVGRLDCVLVRPDLPVLTWCAVEMQAVYLSNSKTGKEVHHFATSDLPLPFPVTGPRPDYRSSGPKRLLPQLQVKVPTLSRWGIKMAVVVDAEFYSSLGEMEYANHPSNADIAWFVMRYVDSPDGQVSLQPQEVHYTTLNEAIEGLVGADPISKPAFEQEITAKLTQNYPTLIMGVIE